MKKTYRLVEHNNKKYRFEGYGQFYPGQDCIYGWSGDSRQVQTSTKAILSDIRTGETKIIDILYIRFVGKMSENY